MSLLAAYPDRVLALDDGTLSTDFEGDLQCIDDGPHGVFVGASDGVYHRLGAGDWERVAAVGDVTSVTVAESGVWAGTEPSAVYHAPEGASFEQCALLTDLPSSDDWAFPPRPSTHHVRWLEWTPDRLYAAVEAGALLRSGDGGDSWRDRVPTGPMDTHSMATHSERPDLAYAAAGDGFYVTEDGGDSWQTAEDGLDRTYCWSVVCDPTDPGALLVSAAHGARSAHTFETADSAVFRRDSDDDAWARCGGLPSAEGLLRAELATTGESGEAVAATNHGVYRTEDWGESWTCLTDGWPPALEDATPRGVVVG
ncbi:WD40/YVTN/BNR-like repeat-containing protein [Halobacterium jilantaiense]|uniref:BNR/Asp-box repeat-containing protein n=1 Tax=Halobacterium jilantaiense TaxID=355548 RepID=A0A1I0QHF1_9EURY|nr:hypothetical protein [Halobacterium jilantaiense]SEW26562.1 hypothetical protein SAMN04487945_2621 [Halobacterium jilantaiense]